MDQGMAWPGKKNRFFFVVNLFKIIKIANFVFNLSLKQAKKQKIDSSLS